ncbi:MAG: hypothetical protein RLZZ153_2416, partial [Pseudomonadota bacterium]
TYTIANTGTTDTGSISVVGDLVAGLSNSTGNAVTGSTPAATGSFTVDTTAPTFTSATTASLAQSSVATTDVIYTAQATDTNSIAFTISGTDSSLFNISASGAVTFKNTQSASTPSDSGANGTYDFTVTATDAAGNASTQAVAFTLTQPSLAGQAIIDLGTGNGKLISPVQVEGNWYYHWDKSNDGSHFGDTIMHNVLDGIFTQTLAELNAGTPGTGTDTTDSIRYGTINGIKLALPTYGWVVDGNGRSTSGTRTGTSVSLNTTTDNPTYNDLLAIWDSYNGTGTSSGGNGSPTELGWRATNADYWSATPAAPTLGQHTIVRLHSGQVTSGGGTSAFSVALQVLPIVIDLNRDGALSYGNVVMDVNGDGLLDATRWAGAQDGVLVWDKYHDGQVHDHSQYAFAQYDTSSAAKGQTATDLSGLADAFDSNDDGVFDARDAQFADFSVWQDANQNGVSDAGEVKTLAELGLSSLNLSSDGVARNPVAGVHEAGHTTATATDGTQLLVADVGFEFTSLAPTSQGQINLISDTRDTSAKLQPLTLQDLLALPTETLFDATPLTDTHTVVNSNDHSHQVYTVDSAQTQLLIDQNIVNGGRVL